MPFQWLRNRRRRQLLATPFPPAWLGIVQANVAFYRELDESDQQRLRDLMQVFVAEKHWEAAGGLELSDEIRVTVSAEACRLILHLEHDLYRDVESIVVYPSTVVPPPRRPSFFSTELTLAERPHPLLGQAFHRGPVILVWDAVRRGARDPHDGKNVVYHEFAHKLDMLTGAADGVPPLADRRAYDMWVETLTRVYEQMKAESSAGQSIFFDPYALTNGPEFFAVATESFFERACEMAVEYPQLYDVFRAFYRQDPAARRLNSPG